MIDVLESSFCYKLIVFFVCCLKNSFCYRLITFLIHCFMDSYVFTMFCSITNKFTKWGKYSFIYKRWMHFTKKEPAYLHSFSYSLFVFCFNKLNSFAAFIYKPFSKILENSYLNRFIFFSESFVFILGAYVVCDHFFRGYFPSIGYLWDKLLFAGLILVCLYKWFAGNTKNIIKVAPLDFSLVAFYAICLLVFIVNNPDTKISIEGMRAVIQYTFWYFIVFWILKSFKNVRVMLLIIVAVGAALGLHGVYQYIANVPMPANWLDSVEFGVKTRVFSIVGSPNILGCLMTMFIPISMAFAFAEKKVTSKVIFLLAAIVMTACLIFTSSRGAWIGFAGAVIVYVFLKDKRLIIPACILLLLVVILIPSVSSRITYMLTPEYTNSSLRGGRLARWSNGLGVISNYPFFGLGFGQLGGAVAMNNNIKDTYYMDNYYLKTGVEMGLVGLISFILLMLSVLKWGYKTFVDLSDTYYKEIIIGILSGLSGVMVHNFFENIFEVPYMVGYFWILAAVIMCIRNLYGKGLAQEVT